MATTTVTFSEPERKLIQQMAYAVWNECAYDLLQMAAEEGRDTVSRDEVIEIALDAGRMEERLRRHKDSTPDLLARVEAASYEALIAVVKPAFPHRRYGL